MPHAAQDTMERLFRYKAWADDALLTALAALDPETQAVQLALKALSHSYAVDQIFAAHLRKKEHFYTSANPMPLPTLDTLAADLRASDQVYIAYVAGLSPDQLAERIDFRFTDGASGRMSREEMLLHIITHGVGHRGQISALMLLNSLSPAKDGFTTYLHEADGPERGRM